MQNTNKFLNFASFLLLLNIKICDCFQSKPLNTVNVDFSVDDILNNDLIPIKIVTDELSRVFHHESTSSEKKSTHPLLCSYVNSSDFSSAMRAMRYHRQMMNEFLLSDYISKEIVGSIPKSANFTEAIEKRFGRAKNSSLAAKLSDTNSMPLNHKLIEDEGSSQYSTWLKRVNTFEDIQQQLLNKRKELSGLKRKYPADRRQSLSINLDTTNGKADVDYGFESLEDGDITGYAFANNPTEQTIPIHFHKSNQKSMIDGKSGNLYNHAISKVGYHNGYDDFTAPPHQLHNYASASPSTNTREIGLKDITDIALTTLAFLSFGMFILQVLMCITMSKDDTSNMVMLPMEGTDGGDELSDGNTEEIRRKRRSILFTPTQNIEVIDHLAKRALFSLNGVTSISRDGGACHHYSLCENNKFTRRLRDFKKLWIPAWR